MMISSTLQENNPQIQRVKPMIRIPLETRVETGLTIIKLEWIHLNPCDNITELAEKIPNDRIKNMIYDLAEQCQNTYTQDYLTALNELLEAYNTSLSRMKREPFTLAVLGIMVISNIAIVMYQKYDPNSAFNQIKTHTKMIEQFHDKFEHQYNVNAKAIESLEELTNQHNKTAQTLESLINISPVLHWMGPSINYKINRHAEIIRLMAIGKMTKKLPTLPPRYSSRGTSLRGDVKN